jgi:hypothetical protein
MNLAVRHLKAIGYRASGLISDEELVKAVRAKTSVHHYDEVILATRRQGGGWREQPSDWCSISPGTSPRARQV